MLDFPWHLESGLKFISIRILIIDVVFHEKQEKIQFVLLDGGQRSYFISEVEQNLFSRRTQICVSVFEWRG